MLQRILSAVVVLACIVIVSGVVYNAVGSARYKPLTVERSGFFTGTCAQPPDPILRGPYPASPSWDGLRDTSEAALVEYSLKYSPALGSY